MTTMRIHILFAGLFALGGCVPRATNMDAPKSEGPTKSSQDQAEAAAIESALKTLSTTKTDYRIGAADLINITVFQNKDLDRKVRVSQKGTISLPLVGNIELGGLSVVDAETTVATKLKEFIVDPQVTIFIEEYANQKVTVLGEVQKPGSYPLPTESPLSVLEAISLAGGFTPVAAKDRTKVIRQDKSGQNTSIIVEVSAITQRGEKQRDIPLIPGDVIFVPQSFF